MVKEWTHSLLNQGIPQGFSQGSQDNVIIPQYKEGDINQFTRHQTNMLAPCMAKLLRSLVEHQLNEFLTTARDLWEKQDSDPKSETSAHLLCW